MKTFVFSVVAIDNSAVVISVKRVICHTDIRVSYLLGPGH